MGAQPYMYDAEKRSSSRFADREFDPKAVTRASWEPKPKKEKQEGPLVSFNRHPDLHEVPQSRISRHRPMSDTTKWFIKWTRYLQILFRSLELVAGLGLMVLMILFTNVDAITSWVMRITPGVVAVCCVYSIWHHARPARSRPPASSAAYQLFASVTDLAVLPLYAYGALAVVNHGTEWDTLITNKDYLEYFVASEYYALLVAGGLHVVSLCISVWLAVMFRRIASMPPDMNPLEGNLTSRMHKRNKSSVTTTSTGATDSLHRLSTPLEDHRRSGHTYESLSRPPSIPFTHTRQGSVESFRSSNRDSRADLPSRQYQIPAANTSRHSIASFTTARTQPASRSSHRGDYTEIPLRETGGSPSTRPSSVSGPMPQQPINASPTRVAKFTEAWYASDSLISRTQQRQRAMDAAEHHRNRAYEALNQRYDNTMGDEDDSDYESENRNIRPDPLAVSDFEDEDSDDERRNVHDGGSSPINASARMSQQQTMYNGMYSQMHPNPLRSNPSATKNTPVATSSSATPSTALPPARQKTPFRALRDSIGALSEVNLNSRRVSGGQDIADVRPLSLSALSIGKKQGQSKHHRLGSIGRSGASSRNRDSSIQPEHEFYAKPYGDLKPGTPPVLVGSGRQVSSGNDYEYSNGAPSGMGYRRNVSGKVAEEGLAGPKGGYSRFSILNDSEE